MSQHVSFLENSVKHNDHMHFWSMFKNYFEQHGVTSFKLKDNSVSILKATT